MWRLGSEQCNYYPITAYTIMKIALHVCMDYLVSAVSNKAHLSEKYFIIILQGWLLARR